MFGLALAFNLQYKFETQHLRVMEIIKLNQTEEKEEAVLKHKLLFLKGVESSQVKSVLAHCYTNNNKRFTEKQTNFDLGIGINIE